MKSLYVTSVERHSGKTAVCLGLGKHFQQEGKSIAYIKPLSMQPVTIEGHIADEDAIFVQQTLGLEQCPWEMSPFVLTPQSLREQLQKDPEIDHLDEVTRACGEAGEGKDILLMEGGASLREGYAAGLPTHAVARKLNSSVLAVVRYHDEVQLLDDVLNIKDRLDDQLCGVIVNRVPKGSYNLVSELLIPTMEKRQIPVLGMLVENRTLAAVSVDELIQELDAQVLAPSTKPNALVESFIVGAMSMDSALSRFRRSRNKAVITGGDRADIQLAALETSTTCLILTGSLPPSPLIVKQAKEFGVAVLVVPTHTMETIALIEDLSIRTRIRQPAKMRQFLKVFEKYVDFDRLYQILGMSA